MTMQRAAAKPGFLKSCVQSLVRWAGVPPGAGDGFAYNKDQIGYATCAGVSVNAGTALQLATVWACVSLLADTISTLPLGFYERAPDGSRKPATSHQLYGVLRRQPNQRQTMPQLLGATIASMLFWGNAYWERTVLNGQTLGVGFLCPDRLQKRVDSDGKVRWFYTDPGRFTQREIPASVLVRIPGFSLDGENGLSAIAYGCRMFGNAIAADSAAASTFEKGLLPTTVWNYPTGTLKSDQRDQAREAIKLLSGAVNAGNPVILEAGIAVQEVGIKPGDAQLLESRGFSTEEICRWFRVPPFMVGHAEKSTSWGTGIEQQMIGFVTFALRPHLKRIEDAISQCLRIEERDRYYGEFALEGLLRGDSQARASFYSTALQNGWLSRNEVRRLENLPTVEGGDTITVQSNLVPLDQLGQAPADAAARASLLTWLGIKETPHAA